MLKALKSEFRKLLTVRSTYIITGIVLAGVALVSFLVFGRMEDAGSPDSPRFMYSVIHTMISMFATFATIIAILLATHEYRYNMITYTLTAARSRLKVLLSKVIVVLAYSLVIGVLVAALAYICASLGVSSVGKTIVAQDLDIWSTLWRLGSYTLAYALLGLILGLLIRGVVGAIVIYFFTPAVEQILSLVLKSNAQYLPFQVIESIVTVSPIAYMNGGQPMSNLAALGYATAYLVVGGVIAAILFVRRDATK